MNLNRIKGLTKKTFSIIGYGAIAGFLLGLVYSELKPSSMDKLRSQDILRTKAHYYFTKSNELLMLYDTMRRGDYIKTEDRLQALLKFYRGDIEMYLERYGEVIPSDVKQSLESKIRDINSVLEVHMHE